MTVCEPGDPRGSAKPIHAIGRALRFDLAGATLPCHRPCPAEPYPAPPRGATASPARLDRGPFRVCAL